jgi:hypothetical protein
MGPTAWTDPSSLTSGATASHWLGPRMASDRYLSGPNHDAVAIFTIRPDGLAKRQRTPRSALVRSRAWSPSGSRIATVKRRDLGSRGRTPPTRLAGRQIPPRCRFAARLERSLNRMMGWTAGELTRRRCRLRDSRALQPASLSPSGRRPVLSANRTRAESDRLPDSRSTLIEALGRDLTVPTAKR